jgi:hypothetical protein
MTRIRKSTHGGKRPGAGRPTKYPKPLRRKQVMLDLGSIVILLQLGKGNLSEGIRRAAALAWEARSGAV